MIPQILEAFRRRQQYRRLIEIDGSDLLRRYGQRAQAFAMQYAAQGAAHLSEGRRPGHWERVARCVARRPRPTRSGTAFG